ncbi:MAG: hypothetical protein K0R39_2857 [Symbiobacteriaceae bacterium]|jgi:hypothetical protein|nr:hypothetical protein [Symbiobacteriaceae bacterium]
METKVMESEHQLIAEQFAKLIAQHHGDWRLIGKAIGQEDPTSLASQLAVKEAFEKLASGDAALFQSLQDDQADLVAPATASDGKDAYEIHKKRIPPYVGPWIPYEEVLYISHATLGRATNIGELIAIVSATWGPEAVALAVAIGVSLWVLNNTDKGHGVWIKRTPPYVGIITFGAQ